METKAIPFIKPLTGEAVGLENDIDRVRKMVRVVNGIVNDEASNLEEMRYDIGTMLEMAEEALESIRENIFHGFYEEPEEKKEEKPTSEDDKKEADNHG